jgi:autotransporter strand-loop-strand O-heptosyltransferase
LIELIKVLQESEFFIGISSGLSWLSWVCGIPTVIISGFTDKYLEPFDNVYRVINKEVCNGCWHTHKFDPSDWNWCPIHKDTERKFECSKTITSNKMIEEINKLIK